MTSINHKLAAAIAALAMLAPAAGAQAACREAHHAAGHVTASASQRHWTTSHCRGEGMKIRRDNRSI